MFKETGSSTNPLSDMRLWEAFIVWTSKVMKTPFHRVRVSSRSRRVIAWRSYCKNSLHWSVVCSAFLSYSRQLRSDCHLESAIHVQLQLRTVLYARICLLQARPSCPQISGLVSPPFWRMGPSNTGSWFQSITTLEIQDGCLRI